MMFNPEKVESKIQLIVNIFGFVKMKYFQIKCFTLQVCIHVGKKTLKLSRIQPGHCQVLLFFKFGIFTITIILLLIVLKSTKYLRQQFYFHSPFTKTSLPPSPPTLLGVICHYVRRCVIKHQG